MQRPSYYLYLKRGKFYGTLQASVNLVSRCFYMRSLSLVLDRAESAEHRVEVTFALSGCPKVPVGCSCKDLGLPDPTLCLVSEANPAASRCIIPLGSSIVFIHSWTNDKAMMTGMLK